jgi:hypothetical protein
LSGWFWVFIAVLVVVLLMMLSAFMMTLFGHMFLLAWKHPFITIGLMIFIASVIKFAFFGR